MFTEEEISQHTPMMQAYLRIKNDHLDKLVFYRMGDFYEMFFEDAVIASKLLGITLTKRGKAGDRPIEMAGIPAHAIDNYINKAIKKGCSIVICDQVGEAEGGKGIMKREVTKIITPGTILDSTILEEKDINYLASLYKRGNNVDLAWINFASGEIWCQTLNYKDVLNEILKINPSEILIPDNQSNYFSFADNISVRELPSWEYDIVLAKNNIEKIFGAKYVYKFGLESDTVANVIYTLIAYLKETQCTEINHINNIKWVRNKDYLQIDNNTKKHLEIINSNSDHSNSLWNHMDLCSTVMGSRLLKEWLNKPITNKNEINSRLDRVEVLKATNGLYHSWRGIASEWCDIERISTKISLKSVRPRELAALRDTLRNIPKLLDWSNKLPKHFSGMLLHCLPPENISHLLEKYLKEEPDVWLRDGNVIADGVDAELDECRSLQTGHSKFLKEYENQLKITTGIANLKVEYNSAQGFFISVSKSHVEKVPVEFKRRQTLKNAERYTTKELKEYEEKALSAKDKALSREKYLYNFLLSKLSPYVVALQVLSKTLAEWDILNTFAELADKYDYCRPIFTIDSEIEMLDGRHPVIERVQPSFVPNTITLSSKTNMAIITGPNMGGKSTVMRQLALLIIMAHIGSFVPANKLVVPEVDAIYTRIGANDDIAQGMSTFMVEMTETAYILNNATDKSLVLLDELGRGTATYDGLSLAWSIAENLSNEIKAYTLFATHYLEMTKLPEKHSNIKNYHVSAIDNGNTIIFNHLITAGPASKSYGLHVAELAGIGAEIIFNAKKKLISLEGSEQKKQSINSNLESELKNLNLTDMSPLNALLWLSKKQEELK